MFQAIVYYDLRGRELHSIWSIGAICCFHKPFFISLIFCICFINFQGNPYPPFLGNTSRRCGCFLVAMCRSLSSDLGSIKTYGLSKLKPSIQIVPLSSIYPLSLHPVIHYHPFLISSPISHLSTRSSTR